MNMKIPGLLKLSVLTFILSVSLFSCKREDNSTDYSYVEKYPGSWKFYVYLNNKYADSSYTFIYDGVIDHTGTDKLNICYSEDQCLSLRVGTNGEIFDSQNNSIGEFVSENLVHLLLITPRSPVWYSAIDISGQKISAVPFEDLSPKATTYPASGITLKSAILNGQVTAKCIYSNVYFEYGSSINYDKSIKASIIYSDCFPETSNYYVHGLSSGTIYHYRVKAVNSHGTVYGDDMTFSTPQPSDPVTDIDGNVYKTVPAGDYIWMSENLKTTHYKDGTAIPLVAGNKEWSNLTTPAYCWFDNDEATYKATYGALYNWYTVSTGNLCPVGWHVPSDDEWRNLLYALKNEDKNESGFTPLHGGYRSGPTYTAVGQEGHCWSASEYVTYYGSFVGYIQIVNGRMGSQTTLFKNDGRSVRCLKD
jgi:hypothetical protein